MGLFLFSLTLARTISYRPDSTASTICWLDQIGLYIQQNKGTHHKTKKTIFITFFVRKKQGVLLARKLWACCIHCLKRFAWPVLFMPLLVTSTSVSSRTATVGNVGAAIVAHMVCSGRSRIDADICNWKDSGHGGLFSNFSPWFWRPRRQIFLVLFPLCRREFLSTAIHYVDDLGTQPSVLAFKKKGWKKENKLTSLAATIPSRTAMFRFVLRILEHKVRLQPISDAYMAHWSRMKSFRSEIILICF